MPTASGATTQTATDVPRCAHCAPVSDPLKSGCIVWFMSSHAAASPQPRDHRAEDRPRGRQDEEDDDGGGRVLEEHAEADALGDAEQHVAAGAEEHERVDRPVAGDAAEGDRGLVREAGEHEREREGADADEERRRASLAQAMRMRRGSRPKVTRPVRWLHSDVTARMPTTGRMSAIGIVVAWRYSPKACWPPSLKNMIVRAMAMIAPMPISSQRPARVSSILRSSTWTRRAKGTPVVGRGPSMRLGTFASVGRADSAFWRRPPSASRAWWWSWSRSCRHLLSGGVGREVEEHLLETPAVAAAQLGQDDLVGRGDAADGDGLGLDLQAAGRGALRDDRLRRRARP